jgi:hypothetical protein
VVKPEIFNDDDNNVTFLLQEVEPTNNEPHPALLLKMTIM